MSLLNSKEIDESLEEAGVTVDEVRETFSLPESPASVNVKFWIDDYSVMLTMRSYKVSDVVKQLEYVIDLAKDKGWKSTWDKGSDSPKNTYNKPQSSPQAAPGTPTCSVHNRPMKKFDGKYGEFWKCTAKTGDNEWCNQKQSV
jgi:hypothetical protein